MQTMILLDYIKTSDRWQKWGKYYHDKAEKYYLEVSKSALTIATFLLGFVGIFFQINNPVCMSWYEKTLLGLSFILISTSAIVGIFIFMGLNKFLNNAGDYYEELSERLVNQMLKNNKKNGAKYPKEIYKGLKLNIAASNNLSYVQLFTLIGGYVCITIYLLIVLI
jgi:hypothetical protein